MGFKSPVSVLVVIHTSALDVLLLERAKHPGFWQSVTGSCDSGESLLFTALREVAEETGVVASPDDFVDWGLSNRYEIFPEWRQRYEPGVTHNVEHVFGLCLPGKQPVKLEPTEHRDFVWKRYSEAAAACFSWSNRDAVFLLPHHSLNNSEQ